MKKNLTKKYFDQKNFSILDIVLIISAVISGVIGTFVNGGGPIGLPLLFLCVLGIVIFRSTKIKDSEIDLLLKQILSTNGITVTDTTITCYDLRNSTVKKRKDGKLCSRRCFITNISNPSSQEVVFDIYTVDLIDSTVEFVSHRINSDTKVVLIEETVKSNIGSHRTTYLQIDNFDCKIPVILNDYTTSQIIEKLCNR